MKIKNTSLLLLAALLSLHTQAQNASDNFITTWKTKTANESITIPTIGSGYNYTVNWGDGSSDANVTGNATHTYADAGIHTITISGTFPSIKLSTVNIVGGLNRSAAARQIRTVEQWGTIAWTSMRSAFAGCDSLTIKATDAPDLSKVKDMSFAFAGSRSRRPKPLLTGDISRWNVSNVTDMSDMFKNSPFNGDISNWKVSNVTNMSDMFNNADFNNDISKWNVSSVTNMERMFSNAEFNSDISKWNVSSVTDMERMFRGSSFNGDVSKWNVSNVTNMGSMFRKSPFNGDVSKWDVSNVTYMNGMFRESPFNGDISRWNVSNVTDMGSMFSGWFTRNSSFNGDISKWNVSKVTNMGGMFFGSPFNGDISKWDVSKVTDMEVMFWISPFNGDVSKWDVSNVTNMGNMFSESSFNGDISEWNVSNVTDMGSMFNESSFNGDLSEWDISSVTDMNNMFLDNSSMSIGNYDALLVGWSTLDMQAGETRIPSNITFGAPDFYSCRGKSGRDTLLMRYSWSILGDELVPIRTAVATLPAVIVECQVAAADDLTAPTARSSCEEGMGTMVTAAHNIPADAFPLTSDTLITWTYTDAGKSIVQTQRLIVDKGEIIPDQSSLSELTAQCRIPDLTPPTAINCSGEMLMAATTTTPPITASTTITWTYTDGANNTATQTQEVIIGDTEAPTPEISNLPMLTGECPAAAIADLTAPTATDNCDDGTITATTDATFPITSTTTITWTYTDAAGNKLTQTQEVICPLSAAEDEAEAVIFPNPSGRYLEVRSPISGEFQLLSLSGKPLLEGTTDTRVDITFLQSGLYLVQLPDGGLLKFVRE